MWIIAGVLLGFVLLSSIIGFHAGPHTHLVGGVVGVLAAAWLIAMAFNGRSSPLLWLLFGSDLVLSAGIGIVAWKGLTTKVPSGLEQGVRTLVSKTGIAVTELCLEGVVRIQGENWSATSLNGPITKGSRVQVIGTTGVHLEVWGEETLEPQFAKTDIGDDPPQAPEVALGQENFGMPTTGSGADISNSQKETA